jgi:5-methylcytosine-specific restriction endonuclease McrA
MQFTARNSQNILRKNLPKNLSDTELLTLTLRAAKTEKEATLALLDYLVEVDTRRLYASVNACSSLFDYLVKILGFSHPAASERVNTVRLIRAVPPVKEHLESGKLTLTSAAQIQRFVNAEQKAHPKGKAVTSEEKEKVVDACLGKSKREVEKTLFEKHSEPARLLMQEKVRLVTTTRSEIKFTVEESTLEKLQQLKDLVGHPSLEKIFDLALDALLLSEKKKRGVIQKKLSTNEVKLNGIQAKSDVIDMNAVQGPPADSAILEAQTHVQPTETYQTEAYRTETKPCNALRSEAHRSEAQLNSRFIPIALKRLVFARSHGQCEFVDPRTKTRCHSTFRLQIDHELPRALGGKTESSNLRHLCSAHNLRMATQAGLHLSGFPNQWG